jgi:hypothetical protein
MSTISAATCISLTPANPMSAQNQLMMELAEKMATEPLLDKRQLILAAMIKVFNNDHGAVSHKIQDQVRQMFALRGRSGPKKKINGTVELPPPTPPPPPPKKIERIRLMSDRFCVHCDGQLVLDGQTYSCPKCEAAATQFIVTAPEPDYATAAVNIPAVQYLDAPTRKAEGPGARLYGKPNAG